MKLTNKIKIAFLNLISHRRTTSIIVINLTLITTLIICFFSYYFTLSNELNSKINLSLSCNYIQTYNLENYHEVNNLFNNENIIDYEIIYLTRKTNQTQTTLTISNNQSYTLQPDIDFQILNMNRSSYCFSNNEKQEMKTRFDKEIIKSGRSPTGNNEIVLPQMLLDSFGIQFSDIYEKEITLRVDNIDIISNVKVVGQIDNDYFSLMENVDTQDLIIMTNFNSDILSDYSDIVNAFRCRKLYISDYKDVSNILSQISKVYLDTEYFYNAHQYYENYESLTNQIILVKNIFSLIGGVLAFAIFVSLIITIKHDLTKKRGYLGTLRALGMRTADVYSIIYFELLNYLCLAMVVSILCSLAIMYVLSAILPAILLIELVIQAEYIIIIGCLASIIESVVLFLITMSMAMYSNKTAISDQIRCR